MCPGPQMLRSCARWDGHSTTLPLYHSLLHPPAKDLKSTDLGRSGYLHGAASQTLNACVCAVVVVKGPQGHRATSATPMSTFSECLEVEVGFLMEMEISAPTLVRRGLWSGPFTHLPWEAGQSSFRFCHIPATATATAMPHTLTRESKRI